MYNRNSARTAILSYRGQRSCIASLGRESRASGCIHAYYQVRKYRDSGTTHTVDIPGACVQG